MRSCDHKKPESATVQMLWEAADDEDQYVNEKLRRLRVAMVAVRAACRLKLLIKLEVCGNYMQQPREAELGCLGIETIVRTRDLEKLGRLGGVSGVARLLQTNVGTGISAGSAAVEDEFAKRRRHFGKSNEYPQKSGESLWRFFCEARNDITLNLLVLSGILSVSLGIISEGVMQGWYDGVSILFAVFLVVVVTAVSDFRQSRQFHSLHREKDNIPVQVVRAGRRTGVSIFDIVVGDLVELRIGDQVPADGLFLRGQCLAISTESSLTGESKLFLPDSQHNPFLLSGCKVEEGYGSMLVTAVGTDTESWGHTMVTNDNIAEETPLQARLSSVAVAIGKVGLIVAVLVLVVLLIFYFTGHSTRGSSGVEFRAENTSVSQILNSIVKIFSIALALVVVAVPEGLPLAVTLSLADSMRKMYAVDKALVRRVSACETIGSATTICTHKTGTLTMNKMTVVKAWIAGRIMEHDHDYLSTTTTTPAGSSNIKNSTLGLLFQGIAQNTTGSAFMPKLGAAAATEVSGSPTEKALLRWGLKLGMKFQDTRLQSTVLKMETFNPVRKRAGVALKMSGDHGKAFVHWKGAAEIVLAACNKWQSERGIAIDMSMEKRREMENMIEGMASASLRCVAFAYCEVDDERTLMWDSEEGQLPERDLTLLALVGINEPCRPGVRKAVEQVKAAGVRVRMVTGEYLITAKAIATECSILGATDMAVDGSTFRRWDDREMREKLPRVAVIARALPSDKLLLVKTLQSMGDVVAVTGADTNDAPALHQANIGLSMGIEGTEVARQSSDIVILDDDFASVGRVVQRSRAVFSNVQNFLRFQLTVNVVALAVSFLAAVTSGTVPLTAVQLLWVNLVMDTLGALQLATEPPGDDLMSRPPVRHGEPLLTNTMWRNIAFQAAYQVAILLTLQFYGESLLHLHGRKDAAFINRTIIFNTFVLCQVFNGVNARQLHQRNIFQGILRSHLFLGIAAATLVVQVVMVELLQKFASTTRLDWHHWLLCIGLASLSWPIDFVVVKSIPIPRSSNKSTPVFIVHPDLREALIEKVLKSSH